MYGGYTIESEYAFRFTRALPPRERPYTQDELDAVVILHAGIEIAGSRYDKEAAARRFTTYDAIADNGSGGAYVLGPAIVEWRNQDLATLPIEGRIDKRLRHYFEEHLDPAKPAIWLGDLNVAPQPIDVYHPDRRVNDVDFHIDARKQTKE